MNTDIDISEIIKISQKAGEKILEVYNEEIIIEKKQDDSPLTLADQLSNKIILNYLAKSYPEIPVLSEESKLVDFNQRKKWNVFWLVDPLDGTKEFIKKNGEFTVNIALVKNGLPILGVIHAPDLKMTYYAVEKKGSFKINAKGEKLKLPVKENMDKNLIKVVGSRSHPSQEFNEYIDILKKDYNDVEIKSIGSSLKICIVAEGTADIYPRLGPTMEWDTAAGHIIAKEAGKTVVDETGNELKYNKQNLKNPYFFVK